MRLIFFVEGKSERELLNGLLPRLLKGKDFRVIPFEGKSDLEQQLPIKLKGWGNRSNESRDRFIVLRDQDNGNCKKIKENLRNICDTARQECLIRIACHELESWYLGDLLAVENSLKINGLSKKQEKEKFRKPDNLNNAKEELIKLTNEKYQEISGSREIAKNLNLVGSNRSHSFNVFLQGIRKILEVDS